MTIIKTAWLRRAGVVLWILGLSLVGGVLAATLHSRDYQARQGRAFLVADGTGPGLATAPAAPADPLVVGLIEIPRLGVSAVVREGSDDATLAIAVGHIHGTALPGEGGNMALAGHRDTFFRPLRSIRRGDSISIRWFGGRDQYRVESTEVVGPAETRVLSPTGDPVLTLVTCYPFGFIGHAPNRFVVRASRVPDPALTSRTLKSDEGEGPCDTLDGFRVSSW